MVDQTVLLYILVAAVAFLIYKVNRLERMLEGGARTRRRRPVYGDGKLIPILKDEIPPGPFARGNKGQPHPATDTEE